MYAMLVASISCNKWRCNLRGWVEFLLFAFRFRIESVKQESYEWANRPADTPNGFWVHGHLCDEISISIYIYIAEAKRASKKRLQQQLYISSKHTAAPNISYVNFRVFSPCPSFFMPLSANKGAENRIFNISVNIQTLIALVQASNFSLKHIYTNASISRSSADFVRHLGIWK